MRECINKQALNVSKARYEKSYRKEKSVILKNSFFFNDKFEFLLKLGAYIKHL